MQTIFSTKKILSLEELANESAEVLADRYELWAFTQPIPAGCDSQGMNQSGMPCQQQDDCHQQSMQTDHDCQPQHQDDNCQSQHQDDCQPQHHDDCNNQQQDNDHHDNNNQQNNDDHGQYQGN